MQTRNFFPSSGVRQTQLLGHPTAYGHKEGSTRQTDILLVTPVHYVLSTSWYLDEPQSHKFPSIMQSCQIRQLDTYVIIQRQTKRRITHGRGFQNTKVTRTLSWLKWMSTPRRTTKGTSLVLSAGTGKRSCAIQFAETSLAKQTSKNC